MSGLYKIIGLSIILNQSKGSGLLYSCLNCFQFELHYEPYLFDFCSISQNLYLFFNNSLSHISHQKKGYGVFCIGCLLFSVSHSQYEDKRGHPLKTPRFYLFFESIRRVGWGHHYWHYWIWVMWHSTLDNASQVIKHCSATCRIYNTVLFSTFSFNH